MLQHGTPLTSFKRPSSAASVVVRAVAEPAAKRANGNGNGAKREQPFINVIPKTSWEKGIPPVMVRRRHLKHLLRKQRLRRRHHA